MPATITLGGIKVAPGEHRSIELPLPALYSHSQVYMPVYVINGKRNGPVLFVSAAIHGDEINGVEIIRRLLRQKNINKIKGALIAVPVVNVYGFITQSRYLPDRRDLNRSFPGSEKGSMAARLANTFMQEVVRQCTHGIDLHTGAQGRENLPQIRAKVKGSAETEGMARAFGTPVIINAELRDGSLREAVSQDGIPVLLYEAGEALRFNELSIRAGVNGINRVMRYLGMLPASRKTRHTPAEPLIANYTLWVRAPQSGILRAIVALGTQVSKREVIGWVSDPFGKHQQEVRATADGIIIGRTNLPLVNEGEALFHIAIFDESDNVAELVEVFQETHDPSYDDDINEEPPII
jgi:uncharacterized protein